MVLAIGVALVVAAIVAIVMTVAPVVEPAAGNGDAASRIVAATAQ